VPTIGHGFRRTLVGLKCALRFGAVVAGCGFRRTLVGLK